MCVGWSGFWSKPSTYEVGVDSFSTPQWPSVFKSFSALPFDIMADAPLPAITTNWTDFFYLVTINNKFNSPITLTLKGSISSPSVDVLVGVDYEIDGTNVAIVPDDSNSGTFPFDEAIEIPAGKALGLSFNTVGGIAGNRPSIVLDSLSVA